MNQKDAFRNIARNRGLFKLGSARNVVKFNAGNSTVHERAKAAVCLALTKAGHDFLTEAEFSGGRADIVDLEMGIVIEVLHSESESNLANKAKLYPLPIRFVHAGLVSFPFELEGLMVP